MKEKPELPESLGIRSLQAELSGSLPGGLTSPQGSDPYTHGANGESREVTVNSAARRRDAWQYYYSEEPSVDKHKHPKLNCKEKQKQRVCIKFVTTSKMGRCGVTK